jgi:hypothetical protein
MNHRTIPLSAVESHMKQKCKFINLRDAITLFPDDKKLLGLANRFHNFQAIRNDLRKAHNLLGEVIRFQNQEKLLTSPHLFSAGWFYAVILYARWFKSTEKRPRLDENLFDGQAKLVEKHKYFIDLRDKYIAHYEKEVIGKTEIYLTYSLQGSFLQFSPINLEIYVESKHDLYDLSKLVEHVHNKINDHILPQCEKELREYMTGKPEFAKLFEQAKESSAISESKAHNPYGYDLEFE